LKKLHFPLTVIFILSLSISFAQSGRIVKTDGAEITFRHLVGIMMKDTVYSASAETQRFFHVTYNGKDYDVYFDKLRSISFFQNDTAIIYKLETKTGLTKDIPINFVGIEYITDDPLSSGMMTACLPIISLSSGKQALNIRAIYFD